MSAHAFRLTLVLPWRDPASGTLHMRGTEVRKCDTCGLVLVAGGTYARAAYLQIKSSGFLLDDASRMVWSDVEPARCYAMRAADAPAFGDLLEAAE